MNMYLKAANYIVTHARKPFEWGNWDCNLFVVDFLDHLDGGNRSQQIRNNYNTKLGAVRFQKNYTPAPKWIESQGYKLMVAVPKDFDIVLEQHKHYWTASIAFGGDLWSVTEDVGMTLRPIGSEAYYLGRRNG